MKNKKLNYYFEKMTPNNWDDLIESREINSKDKWGRSPLFYACSQWKFDFVKKFIDNGAHVNQKCKDNKTPLHFAGTKEIVRLLIEKGAHVNAIDDLGNTPLHYVNDPEMIDIFLENKADLNFKNNNGQPPPRKNVRKSENLIKRKINPRIIFKASNS